jgi:hypothetical protein
MIGDGFAHPVFLLAAIPFAVLGLFMAVNMHCLLTYVAAWYRHAIGERLDGHSLLSDYLLGSGVLKLPGMRSAQREIMDWGPHPDPEVERLRLRCRRVGRIGRPVFIVCVLLVTVFMLSGPFMLRGPAH